MRLKRRLTAVFVEMSCAFVVVDAKFIENYYVRVHKLICNLIEMWGENEGDGTEYFPTCLILT